MSAPSSSRTYPPGVPCWVDLQTPDVEAAAAFYGALLGWELTDVMPPDAPGSYLIATLDGRDAAAIAPLDDSDRPAWCTYIAVEDADAATAAVVAAGGSVTLEPVDAGPGGRQAGCLDPGGAPFRLWQARARIGAQAVNEPGGWNFSDLHAQEPAAALAFYRALFDWEPLDAGGFPMVRVRGYGDHLAAHGDPEIHERQAAAGAPAGFADVIGAIVPAAAGEPDHWHVTFSVADRDAAADHATALGATVRQTGETQWTRTALITDPQGAVLTLSEFVMPAG